MSKTLRIACRALPALAVIATAGWMGGIGPAASPFIAEAEAVIGRPLTPVSYAGVARRTTRRAVAAGAAVGAAAAAPTVVVTSPPPPGCVQVVDAYGNSTYRCP